MTEATDTVAGLPAVFTPATRDEIALAIRWGERMCSGPDANIVRHMAAEILHLRQQRNDLQRSNTELLEQARAAKEAEASALRVREFAIGTIRDLTQIQSEIDRGDVVGQVPVSVGTAGNVAYICDAVGRVLFTSQGHYGTKRDARALVKAARGLTKVQARLEPMGAEVKRLRAELDAWRRVSDCKTVDELRGAIESIRYVLWAGVAKPLSVAVHDRVDKINKELARLRSIELESHFLRDEVARLRAASKLDERLADSESKRDQWRDRALAAEGSLDMVYSACADGANRIGLGVKPTNATAACDWISALVGRHAEYHHAFGPVEQAIAVRASTDRALRGAMAALRRPKVGLAVLVRRADGSLLMMLRKGSSGAGTWSVPGGNLEPGETPEQGAARELVEETGIVAKVTMLGAWTHTDLGHDAGTYITLYGVADVPADTVAVNREPDKCDAIGWIRRDEVEHFTLFAPLAKFIAQGIDPYTIQPQHPMLGAAVERIGVVDQAEFVEHNRGIPQPSRGDA